MTALHVHQVGPGVAVQDLGRTGYLAKGLTRGGAADRLAVFEGAALLRQPAHLAVLEMVGTGGTFEATEDIRIALTGAEMTAQIDGATAAWNASHKLTKGSLLSIGPTRTGTYGYLHVGGGFAAEVMLGSRATHQSCGLGDLVAAGDRLPVGQDKSDEVGLTLPSDTRFGGGTVRIVPSMQTDAFADDTRARFEQTIFRRDPRANRQGIRMDSDGEGFSTPKALGIVSEVIVPGDIQITGDGTPFVLMAESQTTGGYPRIGTVLPCDLPRVAQAPAGAALQFQFVTLDEGAAIEARARAAWDALPKSATPLVRDPASIQDLLSYQLVGGAVSATDTPLDKG
ncbi:biotin-dependent carboxyltransferase family protein [Tateyamaria omphalii]|uniref:5-oxoprolinase subunit C family protein n=1 Tax=Tateyamaria omphalii TaxID=299262 RepID=UPI001C99B75B|nr:biotin-dependent carboxyltransferase family protein [Tateyamaria omphalii]MBY5933715.1 biotin-dependent carboxyltransferase family protein [Tateyamaria omphalii]